MWRLLSSAGLSAVLAGRITQHSAEELRGKVPCGCDNKVGVLAPKHALEGIDIAADASCAKPGVHASLTRGRYCSCDEGKAMNWDVARSQAQKRLEEVVKPKMEALKELIEKMQETMGVEIDGSSLSKVKPKVVSFPRSEGAGLWVCCCQSQEKGKCKANAEMESAWFKRGTHHEAPERACSPEAVGSEEAAPEVAQPEPQVNTGSDEEPAEEASEEPEEPQVNTGPEVEKPAEEESEESEEPEEPEVDTGSEEETASVEKAEEPEANQGSSEAPEVRPGRANLLQSIRNGVQLKKVGEDEEVSDTGAEAAAPKAKKAKGRTNLLESIRNGVQLKKVEPSEPVMDSRGKLMKDIQGGMANLKPPKQRKPEVKVERPMSMMDQIRNSPKFKALQEYAQKEAEDEEEEEGWE